MVGEVEDPTSLGGSHRDAHRLCNFPLIESVRDLIAQRLAHDLVAAMTAGAVENSVATRDIVVHGTAVPRLNIALWMNTLGIRLFGKIAMIKTTLVVTGGEIRYSVRGNPTALQVATYEPDSRFTSHIQLLPSTRRRV